MREIKFRLWNADTKEMVYPKLEHSQDYVLQLNCSYVGEFDKARKEYLTVKMPTMQFTGLKDRTEKDIYEGDITKEVYRPLGANPKAYEYSHIAIIEYKNACFGRTNKIAEYKIIDADKCYSHQTNRREEYKHPTQGANWFNNSIPTKHIEVIGNIYENPDLLK